MPKNAGRLTRLGRPVFLCGLNPESRAGWSPGRQMRHRLGRFPASSERNPALRLAGDTEGRRLQRNGSRDRACSGLRSGLWWGPGKKKGRSDASLRRFKGSDTSVSSPKRQTAEAVRSHSLAIALMCQAQSNSFVTALGMNVPATAGFGHQTGTIGLRRESRAQGRSPIRVSSPRRVAP